MKNQRVRHIHINVCNVFNCLFLFISQFPSLKKKFDFKAHEGEVEDMDISPENKVKHRTLIYFLLEYYALICNSDHIFLTAPCHCWPGLFLQCLEWQPVGHRS